MIFSDELDVPKEIVDFSGLRVDTAGEVWELNDPTRKAMIRWAKLKDCDDKAVRALKWYIVRLIVTRSPSHVLNAMSFVARYLCALRDHCSENNVTLETLLWYLQKLREEGTEHYFHHVRYWYIFSVDNVFEGFDEETAFALGELRIKGNKKGFAVLSSDAEEGPLDEFEEIALRRALIRDTGPIPGRAALWLALAFGPNPANLSLLRECDFTAHDFDGETPAAYFLKMPRIKKRSVARSHFKNRYVDQPLARIIQELLNYNQECCRHAGEKRPLFCLWQPRRNLLNGPLAEYAYHYSAQDITASIAECVERLKVVSPRTGKRLRITTRRLRYTFASKMARQGVSPRELAELLDHTDTQHVMIYYSADSRFVERLDETIAEAIGPQVRAFMGTLVERSRSGFVNLIPYRELPELGICDAPFLCGLAPHRTCYTCSKFKPFTDGPHEAVLRSCIEERDQLLRDGNERMAEQLDENILAVGEVVATIRCGAQ